MLSQETVAAITRVANKHDIEPAALCAVVEVESGGKAFAIVDGGKEPIIRFEGHYFHRLLSPIEQGKAVQAGLASPKAGAVKNPGSQAARWDMLKRACEIDRHAAYQSVSWGVGQVMGSHWKWLGFGSVQALVDMARMSVDGQIELMVRFIIKSGLTSALKNHDWAEFARRYNGPAYKKNQYDTRMAKAYARYRDKDVLVLRKGSRGRAVRVLQAELHRAGYEVTIDGIYGSATEDAVQDFQGDHALIVDGVAGPKTRQVLQLEIQVDELVKQSIKDAAPAKKEPGFWARLFNFLFSIRKPSKG